jgi:hypothetical protein
MHIPLWSLLVLFAELLVTASVYFIIWKAYRTGVFLRLFAFAILAYEAIFNVSYMVSKENSVSGTTVYSPYETGMAIFHGVFSLVMFVALVVFFVTASRMYRRGENYFLTHQRLTITFVIAWAISILSGVAFFVSLYLM